MRFLVLGAGAIGGYFGGRLVENNQDVTFLVREGRLAQLQRGGLRIESLYGNAHLNVRTTLAKDLQPVFDIVIIACKAYDLDRAIASVRPGLAADGVVLPLLNGIAHLAGLNEEFGANRVLGGTAKIAVTLTSEGVVKHINRWRDIRLGEQDGGQTERLKAIVAAFPSDSVTAAEVPDIRREMWEKFVHLATAASMTCLMRANVGEIARTDLGTKMFTCLLDLVAEIAARNGYPPRPEFLSEYKSLFSDLESAYTTSMLRDLESGSRTEADHIVGFALGKAREAGLKAPLLEAAFTHLQAYWERRESRGIAGLVLDREAFVARTTA